MLARLNEPALAELAEGYRAELVSGAGHAAMLDGRSLAPLRRHVALNAYKTRASSYAPASRAYLAHFRPMVNFLDVSASTAILPYVAVDMYTCLDITVDHAAWLALLPAQQRAWLFYCPLAEFIAIARASPELHVLVDSAISTPHG